MVAIAALRPRNAGRSWRSGSGVLAVMLIFAGAREGAAQGAFICPVDGAPMAPVSSTFVAVSTQELDPDNDDQPDIPAVAARLAEAGVERITNKIQWEKLEPSPGIYRWELYDPRFLAFAQHRLAVTVTLFGTAFWASSEPDHEDPQTFPPVDIEDWKNFVRQAVQRYGPRIRDWEIWNEPNFGQFFRGTPEDYLELLNAAYDVIKEESPGARVWAPALAFTPWNLGTAFDYLEFVLDNGRFDVVSVHLYFFELFEFRDVASQIRNLLDLRGLAEVPLVITETNLVDSIVNCVYFNAMSQAQQAEFLLDLFACLANAGIEQVFWFKATDTGQRCEKDDSFLRNGLLDEFLEPKESYFALRDLIEHVHQQAIDRIFRDGFESGTAGAWSAAVAGLEAR